MSFRCEQCMTTCESRPSRVVTKARPRTYQLPIGAIALGWEIVAEANLCPACLLTYQPPKIDLEDPQLSHHLLSEEQSV